MDKESVSEGLIVLDFDGVLDEDSDEAYKVTYDLTLDKLNIHLPEEVRNARVMSKWGSGQSVILEELLKGAPVSLEDGLMVHKQTLSEVFPDLIKPVPGAVEILGKLASRYTLALNTAADRDVLLNQVMPKLNIDPGLFTKIVTAEDLDDPGNAKPHPHILQLIMAQTGFKPAETVMVGDSTSDVLTAFDSKVAPIVTLSGNLTAEEALDLGVEHIIEDITQIETTLGKLAMRHRLVC